MGRRSKARLILTCLAYVLTSGGWSWVGALPPLQHAEQVTSAATSQASAQQPQQLSLEERADIFMARKAYADAADYYSRALRQSNQSDPILWNKLGIAYQQQMDFNASRKAYKEAIRHRPNYAEAWNNLGTTFYLANKFSKSVKYYRKAIELSPGSASFHLNLGTSFYRLKKPKEAVDQYRRALMLDPNILNERSTMGTTIQARGSDVDYYFYMAKVFASLGRADEAVRYLRRAFEDGFREFKKLDEDADFLRISQDPSYIALRHNPPVPIKD
jgi:tetratricopeptide (TPR) repeat protein